MLIVAFRDPALPSRLTPEPQVAKIEGRERVYRLD